MNNKYILAGLSLLIGLGLGYLLFSGSVLGGVTNYDSLQLQPSSSSDNALDVRNSGGTSRLVVSGSGVITLSGATTLSSTLTVSGETQLSSLVQGGSVLSPATTTPVVLTAPQACNNSVVNITDWSGRASSTETLTLPSVTALYADCLDTQGDFLEFLVRNNASAAGSSTLIVAGTNIVLTSSTGSGVTIPGGASAKLTMWRLNATATSSGVLINVSVQTDAD